MRPLLVGFIILATTLTTSLWPRATSARDNGSLAALCSSRAAAEACVITSRRPSIGAWTVSQSDQSTEQCIHKCFVDSCLPIPSDECHQRCRRRCNSKD